MWRRIHRVALLSFAWLLVAGGAAHGFSLLPDPKTGSVIGDLEIAARWSPEPDPFGYGSGFHDGLQVAVAADFAERLELTDLDEIALLRRVIRQAFEAWETADLRFDVSFERTPIEGVNHSRQTGWEFDLFAVAGSHPVFSEESYFGITRTSRRMATGRQLTNGALTDGPIITAVDIFINIDLILPLASLLTLERQAQALQRLLMHEIGHGLGLGHPNTFNTFNANYDTDGDPLNVMVLDPFDPFAMLMFSGGRNARAIMSNDRNSLGAGIFFTELQNDDRGGRDALYPSVDPCPGDCSGNARVDVTELVTMVSVALGETAIEQCHRADLDRDGGIQVDEILQGVGSALDGCN
jgi:hypothetical protein